MEESLLCGGLEERGARYPRLDLILCPISSQPRYCSRPGPGDVPLKQWAKIGLKHASTARLSNLVAVEKTLIKRVIGVMPKEDLFRVGAALKAALRLVTRRSAAAPDGGGGVT